MQQKASPQTPDQGLRPWTPLGAQPQTQHLAFPVLSIFPKPRVS